MTLNAQLSEFRQPAMAMARASTAGATSWSSQTEAAAEPLSVSSAYSSWTHDWNTAVVPSKDSNMAGPRIVHGEATQSEVPSNARCEQLKLESKAILPWPCCIRKQQHTSLLEQATHLIVCRRPCYAHVDRCSAWILLPDTESRLLCRS